MADVTVIEPNISSEENERNLERVKEVLTKIARDMQINGRTIKSNLWWKGWKALKNS